MLGKGVWWYDIPLRSKHIVCNSEWIAAEKICSKDAKNNVSFVASGRCGFIHCTLKLQRKAKACSTLHLSKELIRQFVQLVSKSSLRW